MGDTTKTVIQGSEARRRGVEAIETGGRLLAALADAGGPMMLRDLADAARMPPAKAHRYLVSLIRVGLARQLPGSGRYDIGPLAIRLGAAGLGRGDTLAIARERLPALRDELGLSVAIATWVDSRVLVVDWIDARALVAASLRIGASMPLTRSATGRAFAAFDRRPEIAAALRAELAANGRAGLRPASAAEFEPVLRAARSHGVARVTGDLVPGIDSLAAPVRGPGGALSMVVAAIGPSRGFDVTWNGEVARRLREWAAELGSWRAAPGRSPA
jgi:DNA-binding IclR family transcriptional regulator